MAFTYDPQVEHLLRRAGFGARPDELDVYRTESFTAAVTRLVEYERIPDTVDQNINLPAPTPYLIVQANNRVTFSPASNIADARQRWVFRMLHTDRPLQEKMTLFWHNHFATGYSKLVGQLGAADATRYMAAKPSEDPGRVRGQVEMLRDMALGNFGDILVSISKDVAMLYWLDGYLNTRTRPQENFGREIMELFTMGVANYTEPDVYAAARVFSGWNVRTVGNAADGSRHLEYVFVPGNHDTAAKTFTFPIYSDGSKTIQARAAADGERDGLDFIAALAASPNTAKYLAGKLYQFFVSESGSVDTAWVNNIANVYLRNNGDMKAVMRAVLLSNEFWDSDNQFARFSWPVEFVVRSLKDIGWNGASAADTLTPLANMGQNLYDPPDVAGWDLGPRWFSTGSMLSRMNYASALALNQKTKLGDRARPYAETPESLLTYVLDSLKTSTLDRETMSALNDYLRATGPWTGTTRQIEDKTAGLVHLVAGTPEYQFV